MTVQTKEVEYCKLHVHYTADPDVVMEKREEALDELKKSGVKVAGFRSPPSKTKNGKKKVRSKKKRKSTTKGRKLPAFEQALKKQYRRHLDTTVSKELVAEGYDESLYEAKIKPIGYPDVSNISLDGNNFSCDMLFLHAPSFELSDYRDFDIPKPAQEDPTVEAEAMLQSFREQHGDVLPFGEDDVVQEGNSLTMDVRTTVDGKEVESLTKQGMFYTLGEFTSEEFNTHLLGMKAGESKDFSIKFPDEENFNPELRGQKADFAVTVHMGTKKIPAALDDELAQKVGVESMTKLREQVTQTAKQRGEVRSNLKVVEQLVNRLLANHEFEVPSWLVLMESQKSAAQSGVQWADLSDEQIEQLNEKSKSEVKLSFILDAIREAEPEAVFSEMELINQLKANLQMQGQPNPDLVINQMAQNGTLVGHIARLKDEATVQWLVNTCKIVE